MGCTGSGKTTFINCVANAGLEVGYGPQSCTSNIQTASIRLGHANITLIDTPGFDHTELPQAEILKLIATFLRKTYSGGKKLTGVIFFHRIFENRMQAGISLQTFRLFHKLCGDDAMKNVTIVTTMWDTVAPQTGEDRLRELQENYFKPACDGGACIARHHNTPESAVRILSALLRLPSKALRIQDELHEGKTIPQTDAGYEFDQQLQQKCTQQQCGVNKLKKELAEPEQSPETSARVDGSSRRGPEEGDEATGRHRQEDVERLRDDLQTLRQKLQKTEAERDKLQRDLSQRHSSHLQNILKHMMNINAQSSESPLREVVSLVALCILCCCSTTSLASLAAGWSTD
ncbi:P-loop containing nucleoside triphosphate hydrolase protein [Rhodofomes roseus]|uniref:P-loop containing nucleoside triphosphate hydrolase protein n=1 Tax=Rhodofomes roseus TaxID=34475 RepID=A0ABQ8JY58_9APHY|nr:P-loop containing nucleoside triphosphate hydrolase protein [Rhodofomes roseus]KAH9829193.1 P-loop containing nucleoside triphosphate hydrolase protein [Rhodofomes roseus]